ncbi:MAG TPA: hypothetical protein VKT80_19845, partial [Chloroflexota bacterium]|nr:hypothetical protein [Chloroflexota bacterium]
NALVGDGYDTTVAVLDIWWPAVLVLIAFLVGGIGIIVHRFFRGDDTTKITFLALVAWLIVPIIPQIHHAVLIYPHYFIVLYPVGFIVMGLAVSWLGKVRNGLPLGAIPVLAVAAIGLVAFGQYIAELDRGAVRPEFGVPLGRQLELVAAANDLAGGGPVYVGSHDSLAPTLAYLSDDRWRIFDDRRGARLPDVGMGSIVILSDPTSVGGVLITRWLAGEQPVTWRLTDSSTVVIYRLEPHVAESSPDFHALDVRFENGLTLAGYRIQEDSQARQIRVDLHWVFTGLPPARPPTIFAHLIAPDGNQQAGLDRPAYDPVDWRANELDLVEVDVPRPSAADTYLVEIGLYDFPDLKRFRIANPGPSGSVDSVKLEAIEIR